MSLTLNGFTGSMGGGVPQSHVTPGSASWTTPGTLPGELATVTVQDFFSQVPWEGTFSLGAGGLGDALGAAETGTTVLSLQLQVSDFFNHFLWEGTPAIGVSTAPLELQEPPSGGESFTLDDFSDLF